MNELIPQHIKDKLTSDEIDELLAVYKDMYMVASVKDVKWALDNIQDINECITTIKVNGQEEVLMPVKYIYNLNL